MEIIYSCKGTADAENASWEGKIRVISLANPYEFEVKARGSYFHLLFGSHTYGNFLCIPNWGVGSEMAGLTDSFWNRERLCEAGLSVVDAHSVADALAELSDYVTL